MTEAQIGIVDSFSGAFVALPEDELLSMKRKLYVANIDFRAEKGSPAFLSRQEKEAWRKSKDAHMEEGHRDGLLPLHAGRYESQVYRKSKRWTRRRQHGTTLDPQEA